jgi:hypothetical protein
MPFKLGNCYLWPMTVQAAHWYKVIGQYLSDDFIAVGYALAHGSHELLMTHGQAEVDAWYYSLPVHPEEFVQCVINVQQQDKRDELPQDTRNESKKASVVDLSIMMQAHHGGDLAQWERYVSAPYILDLADVMAAQAGADGGLPAMLKSRANLALYYYERQIKDRAKNEPND